MTCTDCLDALNDLVDGTLAGDRRREVEAHLHACERCRVVHDDLARIRRLGASLERLQPPAALWVRVEAETRGRAGEPAAWWMRRSAWMPMATAAALVLAVALVYVVQQQFAGTAPAGVGRPPVVAGEEQTDLQSVAAELQLAEQHYDNAIRGLERLASDKNELDPQVAASLQKNLQLIDLAIEESRAALRAQPSSDQAQQSLFEAFRTKIVVLQDTIALINEMRKGNQAEAARIAESLNKS
jgi:predicted anti-sigma-YlaC factor YlaD